MKNFRKVLALILVVATLFSFVAMASAKTADEYKDYADVKYTEAVDVLTAIGITEGYSGSFHPNDPIGRDEVAAMVARLRNGGTLDADLYVGAGNVFADVKGQWSEGYVTYCANLGIVAGRNATTFDPEGKVTGTEVLKMLLCVLGFDAKEQGYTGANWQVNVVRDAKKAGLLIDGVDVYAAATRDEVAQYFLNALNAKMVVGYLGEGIVKMTNSIYQFETITPDAVEGLYEVTYCNAIISRTQLWKCVDGLFLETEDEDDCYARPGHTWSLTVGSKVVWSGLYTDTPVATFTNATEATVNAKLAEILGTDSDGDLKGEVTYYVNGASAQSVNYGNGILIELYAVDGGIRVITKETYIARVSKVSSYYNYFEVENSAKTLARFALNDYELAVDDIVLIHVCNGDCAENYQQLKKQDAWTVKALHDVTVVEPVNADIEYGRGTGDLNSSYVIASGNTYYYAANLGLVLAPVDYINAEDVKANANFDLYLDEYGYIMYWEAHVDAPEYYYAYVNETGISKKQTGWEVGKNGVETETYSYAATLVEFGADGALTAETGAAIDENLYWSALSRLANDGESITGNDVGLLVRYTRDSKGNLVYNADNSTQGTYCYNGHVIGTEQEDYASYADVGARLNKGSYIIKDATSTETGVYAGAKTKFMIRTLNMDGTYSYEQVTGYANLTETYVARAVDTGADGEGQKTNIQYFVDPSNPDFATHVFIDARYTTGAKHFLVTSKIEYRAFTTSILNIYGDDYVAYKAIVDGVESVVLVTEAMDSHIRAGYMYEDTLTYRGVTLVNDDNLPLYVWADKAPEIVKDPVMLNVYNDGTDDFYNVYVDGAYKRRVAAADLVVYTLMGEEQADGTWKIVAVPELVNVLDDPNGRADVKYGYVYFNEEDQITEIYRISETFYMAYFGNTHAGDNEKYEPDNG